LPCFFQHREMNSLISESDESEVGGQQLVTNRKILKNCDDYNMLAIYIYLYISLYVTGRGLRVSYKFQPGPNFLKGGSWWYRT